MKILYVTTISLTMNTFFKPHIEMLVSGGHRVDIACNDHDLPLDPFYGKLGCRFHPISFSRSPLSPDNLRAWGQLKAVIRQGGYDVVHCHTPNASVITRLVCRKFRKGGLKVFYTAHGFHFYKGAPLLNWLAYYPVEKLCSRFTDKLITINREDCQLATNRFHAGSVHHVPGVGIDLSQYKNASIDRKEKRREIGVPENAFLLLSVGELNKNKNHQIIIRAMARLDRPDVHYAIAGTGPEQENLLKLARELGISDQVHLLGYRRDIPALNRAADVFCFPSHREGLGLAAIEAMACGLPLLTSNIHGINDYSQDGVTGFKRAPTDADGFASAMGKLHDSPALRSQMGQHNELLARNYRVCAVTDLLKDIYER